MFLRSLYLRVLSTHDSFKDAYAEVKSEENETRFNVNNNAIFDAEKTRYHHAIIPTLPLPSFEELSETLSSTELHIYEMIVARLFGEHIVPSCSPLSHKTKKQRSACLQLFLFAISFLHARLQEVGHPAGGCE